MSESANTLKIYLPGSCAQLVPALNARFVEETSGRGFEAAKIDQTGNLAQAILDGAEADVFMSANADYMDQLDQAGVIATSRPFARNALCILVRPDLADLIHGVPDLLRPDVRTLLCPSQSDPCGQYTVAMFERSGLQVDFESQKRAGNMRELGPDVRFDLIATGEADAIIIYRSFALRLPDLDLLELSEPFSMADRILFTAGAIRLRDRVHPDAESFVHFLAGPAAQAILAANDFLPVDQ